MLINHKLIGEKSMKSVVLSENEARSLRATMFRPGIETISGITELAEVVRQPAPIEVTEGPLIEPLKRLVSLALTNEVDHVNSLLVAGRSAEAAQRMDFEAGLPAIGSLIHKIGESGIVLGNDALNPSIVQ